MRACCRFCLILLILLPFAAVSQTDHEFWFAAPDIAQAHGDRPIFMRISTMEDTANITFRMPAGLWFTPVTQKINPNTTFSIDLTPWIDSIENAPPNHILNRGLYLQSDHLITAYYECANTSNPGIFSLKGRNALGKDFYIVSQNVYANQLGQESFDIVATEDNTVVTITPSDTIIGHPPKQTFSVTLQKGQTFTCRAYFTTASRTLAGTHVTSTKSVAISWQDDSLYSNSSYDIVCDQVIPNTLTGKEYIVIKGYAQVGSSTNNERVFACATHDTTIIRINGNPTPVDTINTAEQYATTIPFSDSTILIQTTHPVHLLHLSGFNNEFGASIIPHDSCTGSRQIGFNRTNSGTFALLILTKNGNQDSFYLNGSKSVITASDFHVVHGTSGAWVFMRRQFSVAQVPVGANLIKNTRGKFHMGILNMTGPSGEYGYFSNFSSLYLGTLLNMCKGDSIQLDGGPYMTSYEWKKLISGSWSVIDTNRYLMVHDTGYYACLVNDDNCTLRDTVHVVYYPNTTVTLGPDRTICEGTTTMIDPGLYVTYKWSTGSTSRYLTTGSAGTYWVRTTNNNGCVAHDTITVTVDSLPLVPASLTGLSTVCPGQNNVVYTAGNTPFATSWAWLLPPGATGPATGNPVTLNYSLAATSGILKVHGVNSCGTGPDLSLPVTVAALPLPTVTGPDSVCSSTTTTYTTEPGMSGYTWAVSAGGTIVSGGGTGSVTVTWNTLGTQSISVNYTNAAGCPGLSPVSFIVRVLALPVPAISGPDSVCLNGSGTYSTATGMTGYLWSVTGGNIVSGGGTSSVIINWISTGLKSISVTYTDLKGCQPASPTVKTVKITSLPVPTITGSSSQCTGTTATYTTEAGMIGYLWSISSGGSLVSGAGTRTVTVAWNTAGPNSVSVNYTNGSGCTAAVPSSIAVTVNPAPAPLISGNAPVCELSVQSYSTPAFAGHIYTWSVTGGAIQSGQGTSLATIAWGAVGPASVGLTETISSTGCTATAAPLPLTLNPYPLAAGTISGPSAVCENTSGVGFSVPAITFATSYGWSYSGSGITLTNNGTSVVAAFAAGATSGNLQVYGINGCGIGPSSTFAVTVNPRPLVSHTDCNDPMTTTSAQPFPLKGAVPAGGTWSGAGVSAGIFSPSLAGPGSHTITYSYTNRFGCSAATTFTLPVVSPGFFSCGSILTDIRDNQQYPTVNIGGRCWMAANLNFGTLIPSNTHQRDNCVAEKYCYNDLTANCGQQTFYQWDELMQFSDAVTMQGVCPPDWHIPTRVEWDLLVNTLGGQGFAAEALKSSGFSGFDALFSGMRHQNAAWDFFNFAAMFWTSSADGPHKAWAYGLNSYDPSVSWYPASRTHAFSVRCIKN
jgi:uncharacterized protein (TIGR02145 family)